MPIFKFNFSMQITEHVQTETIKTSRYLKQKQLKNPGG